jgi:Rhodopirellula transposase DDE domain
LPLPRGADAHDHGRLRRSNGYRTRLWKTELQALADQTGLSIRVLHLPPGTSKWNWIELRLFSLIGQNRRGKPLISREAIINLIAATTTRAGLEVYAQLDERESPRAVKATDQQLAAVNLTATPSTRSGTTPSNGTLEDQRALIRGVAP